ncbi:hypothetical protein [Chthonobacter albigriseus]|uniref:hypothetical protein n=1 Tax=Chthonobacter albigriseus TaxID=1683161 RepID=UPI0015EF185E|nr:hypothetical protein [Chthonobacter albigriseus]
MLLRTLEQAGEAAHLDEELKLILDAARSASSKGPVVPDPAKVKGWFFEPFDLFVIDERLQRKQEGLICADSVEGIWSYLIRKAMPDTFAHWLDPEILHQYPGEPEMRQALRALRVAGFAELARLDRETQGEPKARQRFIARLGGERSHLDLLDMLAIQDRLPSIERLLGRLPSGVIASETSERLLVEQVVSFVVEQPGESPWVAAAIRSRIASPVTLARVAIAVAGSSDTVDIRRTPASCFIDVALACVERSVIRYEQIRRDPKEIAGLVQEIKRYHDMVRALTTALEFDYDATWRQTLAGLRKQMSDLVTLDVEGIVPSVRRALRVDDKERPSQVDEIEAIRATSVLVAVRKCKDSLAVNEMVTRVTTTTEQSIEVLGQRLLDQLRKAVGSLRTDSIAASDTLLKLSELMFGEEHSAILRRAREKAMNARGSLPNAG